VVAGAEMLAKRIIPTILMKGRQLVKGERFESDRVVGDALQAARIHAMRGVDEILMLDVTATKEGREPDYAMVEQLTRTARVPVTVGGGITEVEHVRKLLAAGADKVSIGSSKQGMVSRISHKCGTQCVAVTIDDFGSRDAVMVFAQDLENAGAGEIILQSIYRDGTMQGYDLPLIEFISGLVSIPVVASGGCSGYPDMHAAIDAGASAVAAGALFQFTDATPRRAAEYLHEQGVEVRL
jgi:imidazole glycerol-phosphate synthase subunit HisF